MTPQARKRRLQDTLIIVGGGVIAFSAWTLAKTTSYFFLYSEDAQRQLFEISDDVSMSAFYISFAVVAAIDVAMRLFVGLSARAEGRGRRKGFAYLVVAALLALGSVASIVLIVLGRAVSPSLLDLFITVVIEATSIATLVLMISCSIRLRRLNGLEE